MGENDPGGLSSAQTPLCSAKWRRRDLYVAKKLKSEGVMAGVADLCLPAARRGYHGLYLEMKSEEGIATKEQKAFLRSVLEESYCAVIGHGVDEARRAGMVYGYHRERTTVCATNRPDLPSPALQRLDGATTCKVEMILSRVN